MKTTLAFLVLLFSTIVSADICTVVIRDRSGHDYDSFTRSSYSSSAACDNATWDCRQKLSDYQSYGRYYDAICIVKDLTPSYPMPPFPPTYPRYPDYPREPSYPREPRYPREPSYPREPNYPSPRDPREPPRNEPGSEPRRPGPRPR